jgi:hypothetical protein
MEVCKGRVVILDEQLKWCLYRDLEVAKTKVKAGCMPSISLGL